MSLKSLGERLVSASTFMGVNAGEGTSDLRISYVRFSQARLVRMAGMRGTNISMKGAYEGLIKELRHFLLFIRDPFDRVGVRTH